MKCILHSFVNVAVDFGTEAIHVPLPILRSMQEKEKKKFTDIGTSCHSVAEAKEAKYWVVLISLQDMYLQQIVKKMFLHVGWIF